MHITIDSKLYPFVPPKVKLVKPRMKKSVHHLISSMPMIGKNSWDPTNNLNDVWFVNFLAMFATFVRFYIFILVLITWEYNKTFSWFL